MRSAREERSGRADHEQRPLMPPAQDAADFSAGDQRTAQGFIYRNDKMKQETIDRIRKFTADRDWEQFHTPKNLSMGISKLLRIAVRSRI